MNYLLDTHVLLWWLGDLPQLSDDAREIIASPENLIFVSAASAWEITIKKSIGKLEAPDDLASASASCRFEALPVSVEHAQQVGALPPHHTDPFDRMLVAQATIENLTLISRDRKMHLYEIQILSV